MMDMFMNSQLIPSKPIPCPSRILPGASRNWPIWPGAELKIRSRRIAEELSSTVKMRGNWVKALCTERCKDMLIDKKAQKSKERIKGHTHHRQKTRNVKSHTQKHHTHTHQTWST